MNEYERIYDCISILLKDFREPLLSFDLIYFRNLFCYRTVEVLGKKFWAMSNFGPRSNNANLVLDVFCSLERATIFGQLTLPILSLWCPHLIPRGGGSGGRGVGQTPCYLRNRCPHELEFCRVLETSFNALEMLKLFI